MSSGHAEVAYRKSFLGGDEPGRFSPGDGPVALQVDSWRVGLGICKDTGVDQHVSGIAALGVDLYVAGLAHLPEELAVQEERAARIARTCDAYVAFASFAGATGGGFARTAGVSSIWRKDGQAIARAGPEPGGVICAALGERLISPRKRERFASRCVISLRRDRGAPSRRSARQRSRCPSTYGAHTR